MRLPSKTSSKTPMPDTTDLPLYPGGPSVDQLRDPDSGWHIHPAILNDYLDTVGDPRAAVAAGKRLASFGPDLVHRARLAFPELPVDYENNPVGLDLAAWGTHLALCDMATHEVEVRYAQARAEEHRRTHVLCQRCGVAEGFRRPVWPSLPGRGVRRVCDDCEVILVAETIDRVRART